MVPTRSDAPEKNEEALRVHRGFQAVAARAFAAGAAEAGYDFTEAELREESALRCWVRLLDLGAGAPRHLPDRQELHHLANLWDIEYGPHAWWTWPVWSSCAACAAKEKAACPQCEEMGRFCPLSMLWRQARARDLIRDAAAKFDVLAATRGWQISEEEARREAAFRCQLLSREGAADVSELELDCNAESYDGVYGARAWWSWSAWATCPSCDALERSACAECLDLCWHCWVAANQCDAFDGDGATPRGRCCTPPADAGLTLGALAPPSE